MGRVTGFFRKKPVVVEALCWDGENIIEVTAFLHSGEGEAPGPVYVGDQYTNADDLVGIWTLEGFVVADKGDWIIRGVKGEFYPCKPDIFEMTYEAVGND